MSLELIDEAIAALKNAHATVATAKQQVTAAQVIEAQAVKDLAMAQHSLHSKIDQACQDFAAVVKSTVVEQTGTAPLVSVSEAAGITH